MTEGIIDFLKEINVQQKNNRILQHSAAFQLFIFAHKRLAVRKSGELIGCRNCNNACTVLPDNRCNHQNDQYEYNKNQDHQCGHLLTLFRIQVCIVIHYHQTCMEKSGIMDFAVGLVLSEKCSSAQPQFCCLRQISVKISLTPCQQTAFRKCIFPEIPFLCPGKDNISVFLHIKSLCPVLRMIQIHEVRKILCRRRYIQDTGTFSRSIRNSAHRRQNSLPFTGSSASRFILFCPEHKIEAHLIPACTYIITQKIVRTGISLSVKSTCRFAFLCSIPAPHD